MQAIVEDPLALFYDGIRNPVTRDKYERRLFSFLGSIDIAGSSLDEKAKAFVARAREDPSWAAYSIIDYLRRQKSRAERKEISAATVPNFYKPIKLFCEMNDIVLNWKKIRKTLPQGRRHANDRAPSIDEIRLITNDGDLRLKCAILIMVSSGIRLGAWDYLEWGHIEPIIKDGRLIAAKIRVYAGDPDEYYSFITPEAYNALEFYMGFREMHGESISKSSPLLRDRFESTSKGSRGFASVPKRLKSSGLKRLIDRALWKYGIRTEKKRRHEFAMDHGFRKFFKTRAEQVMKPANVELLLGHSIGISDSYYRPTEKDLLEDYLKAVPLLTINQPQVQTDDRKELEDKVKMMEQQLAYMMGMIEEFRKEGKLMSNSISGRAVFKINQDQ